MVIIWDYNEIIIIIIWEYIPIMVVIRIWLTLIHVPDHDALGPPRRRPLRRRCRRRRGRCRKQRGALRRLGGRRGRAGRHWRRGTETATRPGDRELMGVLIHGFFHDFYPWKRQETWHIRCLTMNNWQLTSTDNETTVFKPEQNWCFSHENNVSTQRKCIF